MSRYTVVLPFGFGARPVRGFSVRDLNAKIRAYIDGWNDRCHPFTWTKTADQILAQANRKKTSPAEH